VTTAESCAFCHNGTDAIGVDDKPNPPPHVPTSQDCVICHTAGGAFTPSLFDHVGITDNCASCHDGNYATGTDAKTGSPHIPIELPIGSGNFQDCSVCHNPTKFANARFEHQGISGNCATCHNGSTATGKNNFHVPTNDDCSVCHYTTGFKPANFDHVGIVDNCASCHDAGFATPKDSGHLDTTQDCGICHNTSGFKPATFDHSGIKDGCADCHDGNTATGKVDANPTHIEPADQDCHFCHTTATFAGGTWVHGADTANHCLDCHDDGGRATPKSNGHLNTTDQCDVCHTTDRWAPTNFSHASDSEFTKQKLGTHRRDPGCNGCHGTKIGSRPDGIQWLPSKSSQYAPACAACHSNRFRAKGDHRGGKSGTVEQNKGCGDSRCHKVSSSGF
jgi:predicted CXXCH cytochrome family protein